MTLHHPTYGQVAETHGQTCTSCAALIVTLARARKSESKVSGLRVNYFGMRSHGLCALVVQGFTPLETSEDHWAAAQAATDKAREQVLTHPASAARRARC